MNTFLVILLLVFGVLLMIAELFFIPGVGFAGLFSILSLAASVVLAYLTISPMAGHVTLLAVLLLVLASIYAFIKGKTLDKMALHTNVDSKVDLVSEVEVQEGDIVMTVSRLAPMGKVRVGDTELEAKSMDDFIDPSTPVSIVKKDGNVLLVRRA